MSDAASAALALARIRAAGTVAMPEDGATLAAWAAAAQRAGRRLCDVSCPGGPAAVALGWAEGAEPAGGGDSGVDRTEPSTVLLLVFAAAIRACWQDRSEHPFPGIIVEERAVLDAVAALGPLTRAATETGEGSERHCKGALRRLREAGLLYPSGRGVRLGPVVALWSNAQVGALRAIYDQLPLASVVDSMEAS